MIKGTGTIKHLELEGGFYGIIGDDGTNYDPINLTEEFRQDGLRVEYHVQVLEDRASFHMWGKIVEIIKIKKLE